MKMGVLHCPLCAAANTYYSQSCISCGSNLRNRVVNLDFQPTLSLLIHSPSAALRDIVFAEHKNFALVIGVAAVAKLVVSALLISPYLLNMQRIKPLHFSVAFGVGLGFLLIWALIQKLLLKSSGTPARFKDQLALICYSGAPALIGLLILFPLEVIIFGEYLFTSAPGPFVLNSTFAWLFVALELMLLLWMQLICFFSLRVQGAPWLLSVVNSLLLFPLVTAAITAVLYILVVYA